MSAGEDPKGRELVPDDWRELDDTLADGPAPAEVPGEARSWLADQRCLHGLLRALHTQDAAAREGRIAGILARIDEAPAAPRTRQWLAVAVAALLLACFGVWLALPASLPTAEAAMQRAVGELSRDVARRFRVAGAPVGGRPGMVGGGEFALVVQPGGRFVVDGRFGPFGNLRFGCDGEQLWYVAMNGMWRGAFPKAERERFLQLFGNAVDLGYLDVHELVRLLPADCEISVVGREVDASGRQQLRIEGEPKSAARRVQMEKIRLLCDEATGMITHVEVETDGPRGRRRVTMQYLGEEPPPLVDFRRPW